MKKVKVKDPEGKTYRIVLCAGMLFNDWGNIKEVVEVNGALVHYDTIHNTHLVLQPGEVEENKFQKTTSHTTSIARFVHDNEYLPGTDKSKLRVARKHGTAPEAPSEPPVLHSDEVYAHLRYGKGVSDYLAHVHQVDGNLVRYTAYKFVETGSNKGMSVDSSNLVRPLRAFHARYDTQAPAAKSKELLAALSKPEFDGPVEGSEGGGE